MAVIGRTGFPVSGHLAPDTREDKDQCPWLASRARSPGQKTSF